VSASFPKLTELVAPDGALQSPASLSPEEFSVLVAEARPAALTGERLLAVQAIRLFIGLDRELVEARSQFNQDLFRRVMRTRSKAVLRLQRRWAKIASAPAIPLGSLRRRYHANLAGHLYEPRL
jgi:hypothetical protein